MMTRIIFSLLCAAALLFAHPLAARSQDALAPDAPDTYVVQRGDTLWSIAERFLQQPWRWPEVWRINRDQVSNPHLIYPGQVIVLDRSGQTLSIGRVLTDQRLSPQVHTEPLDAAIQSIPVADIEPFLTRPLVLDEAIIEGAGTIIATENRRVFMGDGDVIFAKDLSPGPETWQVVRPARPLVHPVTKEVLAYEAQYLGVARQTVPGQPASDERAEVPATLQIVSAVEEIGPGDRLVRSETQRNLSYMPHAPEVDISGRILGIYRGVAETGRHYVVTLTVGKQDGLEVGHVLALHRERGSVRYDGDGRRENFDLPDQRYGVVFVFRVFERVAYAMVMDTSGHVSVGDIVRRP
jgi:hypothetical protein